MNEPNNEKSKPAMNKHDEANNNSFSYPNLFEEASEMTIASILVFFFASVRRLAKEEQLDPSLLELPLSGRRFLEIVTSELDRVKGSIKSNEFDTVIRIFDEYLDSNEELLWNSNLYSFGDDAQHECVYGMTVNDVRKRITLSFRGSTTISDWLTDAQIVCGEWQNPLDPSQTLGVHLGFRNMLLNEGEPILEGISPSMKSIQDTVMKTVPILSKKFSSSSNNDSGRLLQNMDQILTEVEDALEQYPGYRLYITGHSLGGALCSLVALSAAARFGTETRPVSCFPIANPRAGDRNFADAIYQLEQAGRLRCCAIHNHLDVIPRKPTKLFRWKNRAHQQFCPIGYQLLLRPDGLAVTHTQDDNSDSLLMEMKRTLSLPNVPKEHNYQEYWKRLVALRDTLSAMSLNEWYEKRGIHFQ